MNTKYYISESNSIVVLDENNNSREIENIGSIKEKLIQENLIETIENRIKKLEDILVKYPDQEKKFIPLAVIIATISSLTIFFLKCILCKESFVISTNFFEIFNILSENFTFCFPTMMTIQLLGIIIDVANHSNYIEKTNNYNADKTELEALKRILSREKNKLNQLNLDTKNNKFYKYSVNVLKSVNDKQKVDDLNKYSKCYRQVGRCLPILYEAYKKNTLNKLLQEYGFNLSKEEYEILVDYIKQNGQSIVSMKKFKGRRK